MLLLWSVDIPAPHNASRPKAIFCKWFSLPLVVVIPAFTIKNP